MVIKAAYQDPAILHALIGLGSLHEGVIQSPSQYHLERNPKYAFSLRHINNAIKTLGIASGDDGQQPDVRIFLTLCILLTTFESFQGRWADALKHTVQGVKMFASSNMSSILSRSDHTFAKQPFPVSITAISTILNNFALHSVAVTQQPVQIIEIVDLYKPLPDRFHSIQEAEELLQNAMYTMHQRHMTMYIHPSMDVRLDCKRKLSDYLRWVQHWRRAFDAFTARARKQFTRQDVRRALILEANYLYTVCCATVESDPSDFTPFDTQRWAKVDPIMKEMVEICEEVVKLTDLPSLPTVIAVRNSYFTFGAWLHECLFGATTWPTDPEIKQRAAALLATDARPEALMYTGPYNGQNIFEVVRELARHGTYDLSLSSSVTPASGTDESGSSSRMSASQTPSTSPSLGKEL